MPDREDLEGPGALDNLPTKFRNEMQEELAAQEEEGDEEEKEEATNDQVAEGENQDGEDG